MPPLYLTTHPFLLAPLLILGGVREGRSNKACGSTGMPALRQRIQPVRTRAWEEPCEVPSVSATICQGSSCDEGDMSSSDVCSVVSHALLAEYNLFDVVLLRSGACGSEIPAGDLTYDRATEALPRNEQLVGMIVNGSDVVAALEDGIDSYHARGMRGAYPKVAGVRFDVNLTEPYGSRVSGVVVMSSQCQWNDLDTTSDYRLLTEQVLARGGHGYEALTRTPLRSTLAAGVRDAFWFYAESTCYVRSHARQPRQVDPNVILIKYQEKMNHVMESAMASRRQRGRKHNQTIVSAI